MIATAIQLSEHGNVDSDLIRLERFQARLMHHLRDGDLDIEQVSSKEGMSLRTVQRLFQMEGTTPTKWLTNHRLDGVASDIRSSNHAARSISEIAFS